MPSISSAGKIENYDTHGIRPYALCVWGLLGRNYTSEQDETNETNETNETCLPSTAQEEPLEVIELDGQVIYNLKGEA